MPLRIEDPRTPPARPEEPSARTSKRPLPRGWILLVVGAVVLLLAVLVGGMRESLPGQSAEPSAGGPVGSTPPSPPAPPVLNGREVAPGLVLGSASIEALNQDFLHGTRIGYPRTVDGAIAAAINYDAALHTPAMFNRVKRAALNERIYTATGLNEVAVDDELAAAFARQLGINAKGKVVGKGGKVDPRKKLIAATYPRYGAYKLLSYQPSVEAPNEVVVESWRPFVLGTGTDTDRRKVGLGWYQATVTVRWERGDWRVADSVTNLDTAKPSDQSKPNASYSDRAAALGPGWSVPTDATETLLPGTVVP